MTTVRVLGAFAAMVDGAPADLGGPRQRSVLARLVAAHGRMVPSDRLVEDLWPSAAPPRAAAGLQSFVSHLRRALEPGRPPRSPARILVTAPPGYALRLPEDAVDAWRFDALIDRAGAHLEADGRRAAAEARHAARAALDEWRGPAYAEFAALPWAAAEAARLDERRLIAVERRAGAMLRLAAAAEAVPDLEAHAAANPLREEAWRLLALALYRTGRQGDALGALRRARAVLTEELGVDPGPALRRLEADILAQSPDLDDAARPPSQGGALHAVQTAPEQEPEQAPEQEQRGSRTAPPGRRAALRLAPDPSAPAVREPSFVGRAAELARLARAARATEAGRRSIVLIGGDAGMGKTALTERFADTLPGDGWTCAWGRAPETGGAPAAWPWAELLRGLAAAEPPGGDLATRLGPLLDDAVAGAGGDAGTGRFRLHLAVGDYLERLAARAPLLLVLEDLHWADEETLDLLTRLAERLRDHPVLLAGTFRQTEVPDRLAAALAALARHEPLRVELGGLTAAEVAVLVRATCASGVGDAELSAIAERTGGNPFFTRETARLLDAEGTTAAAHRVPAGVGDVLRRRIARLPESAQTVLRHAAVVGRDADLGVLTDLSGGDEDAVIDAVEAGLATGLVTEPGGGRVRFAHALVRDTLYTGLSRARRARLHGRAAAALERHRPGEVGAIAHHYLESGDEPAKAVRYARRAAEAAEARFAHRAAARLWERAVDALRAGDPATTAERLGLEVAAIRESALAGEVVQSRARRLRAIAEARALGDVPLLARVIAAFDVPTLWTSREYGTRDQEVIDAAEEALAALPPGEDELRVRLLTSLAIELEGEPGGRGRGAADEAVRAARLIGCPGLLAVALNGRYLNCYRAAGDLAERRRIAAELLDLATEHDLGSYVVLAHLQLQQVAIASLDLAAAHAHRERGGRLAEQYGLPLLGLVADWLRALAHAFGARYEEAEAAYAEVGAAIGRTGIWSSERGMAFFGVFCLRELRGRAGELLDGSRWIAEQWGHVGVAADVHALALISAGRAAEARRIAADAGPVRLDYFFDLATALRARRAMALDDRPLAEQSYRALLPYEGHVAGGSTAVATLGPVARTLGDLAVFLGRPVETAAAHYRRAAEVAERLGAPRWTQDAREALRALGTPAA